MLPTIFKSSKRYSFSSLSSPFRFWTPSLPSVRRANVVVWPSSSCWWRKTVPSSVVVPIIPTASPSVCCGRWCTNTKYFSLVEPREDGESRKAVLSVVWPSRSSSPLHEINTTRNDVSNRSRDDTTATSTTKNERNTWDAVSFLSTSPCGAVTGPMPPICTPSAVRMHSSCGSVGGVSCTFPPLFHAVLWRLFPTRGKESGGERQSTMWRVRHTGGYRTLNRSVLLSHLSNASLLSSPLLRPQVRCLSATSTVLRQERKHTPPLHRRRSQYLSLKAKGGGGAAPKNGKKRLRRKGSDKGRVVKRTKGKGGTPKGKRSIPLASKGNRHRTKVVSSKHRLPLHRPMFRRLHRRPASCSRPRRGSAAKGHRGKKRAGARRAVRPRAIEKRAPAHSSVTWPKTKGTRKERLRQMQEMKKDLQRQGYPTPPGFLPYLLVHYKSKKNNALLRRAKARGHKGWLSLTEVQALNARWRRSAMAKATTKSGTIQKTRGATHTLPHHSKRRGDAWKKKKKPNARSVARNASSRSSRALPFTTAATTALAASSSSTTLPVDTSSSLRRSPRRQHRASHPARSSRVRLHKKSTKGKKSTTRATHPARRTLLRISKSKKMGRGAARLRRGSLRRLSDSSSLSRGQWRKVKKMIVKPPLSSHHLRFKKERGSGWKKKIGKRHSSKSRSGSRTKSHTSSKKKRHHRQGGKKLKKGNGSILRKHRRDKSARTATLRKKKAQRRILVIPRKKLRGHQLQKMKYNKRVAAIARLWRAQQQKTRREQLQQTQPHPPHSSL